MKLIAVYANRPSHVQFVEMRGAMSAWYFDICGRDLDLYHFERLRRQAWHVDMLARGQCRQSYMGSALTLRPPLTITVGFLNRTASSEQPAFFEYLIFAWARVGLFLLTLTPTCLALNNTFDTPPNTAVTIRT
jgi:hypothetical protein